MVSNFFPSRQELNPKIYAYTENSSKYEGLIKVGYTEREVAQRMGEHYPTKGPAKLQRYKVLLEESSMKNDGTYFKDYDVHKVLKNKGFKNVGGEWYECDIEELRAIIFSIKNNEIIDINRNLNFKLRPEQKKAVEKTQKYFSNFKHFEKSTPHFLWNCKMRFGKTYTSYKLAEKMKWTKVLILTFKPAVENSWKEDLLFHQDFKEWQFISRGHQSIEEIDRTKPYVCFASFQDFLGKNASGGIKIKNKWAHKIKWDCIILDEYHYGAWRDAAKELYESEDNKEQKESLGVGIEDWDEKISPLKTNHYLYLSGTPFRAINSGEFIEEQIYNWTYSDEQKSKLNWSGNNNPYLSLPRMVMMTYQMPENIHQITDTGEYDEFDLNEFFKASGEGDKAIFKHKDYVQQWLNLIRGTGFNNIYDNLKLGSNKPVLPFADSRLINVLNHTFWFLPSVSSCYAMKNLMLEKSNTFYQNYKMIVCAGVKAGIGVKSLKPVRDAMDEPLSCKTITLSCGKLTTGVTVKPWTGLFMLRNTSSPETYFQTAFRVQSPWTVGTNNTNKPNSEEILKKECYIFDFAPNRALKLITNYSCRLDMNENDPESKIEEFIKFLPVLCFDGSSMKQINAQEVLDYGMVGTSGSQLAKKFESAKLVQVDDITLARLLKNKKAMESLMKLEGFRNLNNDIEKILNKSEKINKLKKESVEKDDEHGNKKEISQDEKEQRGLRKQVQEKLQKFSTRIPVFMYLTDYREQTLKDVITKLEPGLFKKVTSVSKDDFELLLSLGVFNASLMNSAIFAFKRYENSSLHYDGITKHNPKEIGLFDTAISREEFYDTK
tara:strand:- start:142 stop:2634 length:2493 start_codon:yes stop_codon:yes gene_type:complete